MKGQGAKRTVTKQAAKVSKPRIVAHTVEDLLSYIPHALGFWPRDSVVFLGWYYQDSSDDKAQLGPIIRANLPRSELLPQVEEPFIHKMVGLIAQEKQNVQCSVVVFSENHWRQRPREYDQLLQRIRVTLLKHGITLAHQLWLGPQLWCHHLEAPQGQEPKQYPIADIPGSSVNAELVYCGSSYAQDSLAAASLAKIPEHQVPRVCAETKVIAAQSPCWLEHEQYYQDALWFWQEYRPEPGKLSAKDLDIIALLAGSFNNFQIRARVFDQIWQARTSGLKSRLAVIASLGPSTSSPKGMVAAEDKVLATMRAYALAALAWLEWLQGHASIAHVHSAHALELAPNCHHAQLIQRLLQAGAVSPVMQLVQ